MSISDDEVEAANVADRILRVVRRFIAAEHKHARLLENPETVLATSRDDVDMEHATLVGFTVEQVDQALRIVQRRAAAKVRAIREGDGEVVAWQVRNIGHEPLTWGLVTDPDLVAYYRRHPERYELRGLVPVSEPIHHGRNGKPTRTGNIGEFRLGRRFGWIRHVGFR